jgi:hypothetical protein
MILALIINFGAHFTEYSIIQISNKDRDAIYNDILNKNYISLTIKSPQLNLNLCQVITIHAKYSSYEWIT